MTLGNSLARFRTVEFFGVLLPGLFMVASLGFGWAAAHATTSAMLVDRIVRHLAGTPQWYPVTAVVLAAYLFGSVVRAFPVWRLDDPLARVFGIAVRRNSSDRMKLLYEGPYPYPSMLKHDWNTLSEGGCISALNTGPAFDKCHAHVALDFCKEYASLKSPAAEIRIQEVEARTRRFYGMFWASAFGIIASVLFAATGASALPLLWWALAVPVGLAFGQRLRFVRGHEARMIYYAYLIRREAELAAAAENSVGAVPSNSGLQLASARNASA